MVNWIIEDLKRKDNGFVIEIFWKLMVQDGLYNESTTGIVSYEHTSDEFIPFEDLTESLIIGWVIEALGQEAQVLEAKLFQAVEEKKKPTIYNGVPWD